MCEMSYWQTGRGRGRGRGGRDGRRAGCKEENKNPTVMWGNILEAEILIEMAENIVEKNKKRILEDILK